MVCSNDKKLSRKEREYLWHRELILNAAEALFSRKGYHDTSVEEIAERAEFSVGYLYKIFENKKDIYQKLIDWRGDEYYQDVFRRIDEASGAKEKLLAVLQCKLEFFERHRQFFGIFANFVSRSDSGPPPLVCEEFRQRYLSYQDKLEEIFSIGMDAGVFKCYEPSLAILALEGMTNAIIGRWIHTGESKLESVEPEVIGDILFNGLFARGDD
jgi:AcrR family transcriptional regulator